MQSTYKKSDINNTNNKLKKHEIEFILSLYAYTSMGTIYMDMFFIAVVVSGRGLKNTWNSTNRRQFIFKMHIYKRFVSATRIASSKHLSDAKSCVR